MAEDLRDIVGRREERGLSQRLAEGALQVRPDRFAMDVLHPRCGENAVEQSRQRRRLECTRLKAGEQRPEFLRRPAGRCRNEGGALTDAEQQLVLLGPGIRAWKEFI